MINADDMQSWAYLLAPTFQFVNTAGKPLTEGWIEVYIAGTRNKYYCASDFNGTLHPFQIPLDSLGANIVLADPDQAYDVYVYNKYGSLAMSRYHVSPGMAGGSGVLSITIGSEDGTVSVTNDGNGNFDLSIQDTVDRIDALEQAVSGLTADSTVGYAIAHAYTVNLDGTFNLINDSVSGIGYTSNMDGFRLKSGHVYQFNFNALFENGEFDRNCSGKLYLEGPNTIAQEWKFDLDDSYYHSQSINGSTVLVTPKDLNYYDVKLKLAWDVDYPNKPNVDLSKISIVDITTILRTNSASGTGGDYIAGDGIFINDETNVISVDMDYINSHLNIDATEIIASAVNIATAYTDARVTSVSGDLVNLIAEVSASIPTGTVTQVQSDWNEQDSSSPAYINNKPDLTVYATNASVSAVSSVLNERINDVSGSIPELPDEEEVEFEEIDLSDYALASAIPDVSDFVTHNEVSAVSGNIIEYVNSVSGDLVETINNVSGDIIHTVESVSAVLEGDIVSAIQVATGAIPEQVNSDWNAVSGKAEILNKPDLSIYATHDELVDAVTAVSSMIPTDYVTHNEVSAVSANLVNYVNSVSGDITNYVDESIVSAINVATGSFEQVQSDWTEDDTNDPAYIQNKPNEIELIAGQNIGIFSTDSTITIAASATDLSNYATHSEVNSVSGTLNNAISNKKDKQTAYSSSGSNTKTITNISQNANGEISVTYSNISYPQQTPSVEIVSPSGTLNISSSTSGNTKTFSIDIAPTSGIEYGQFYATNITGAATMSRTKGNIDITNDGKIKLKKGQSYHVTVRGRYNQSVLKDNYSYASYIEYVTNNSININVDESRSGSQYFELSYDLFKLNSDTDYYVFFTLDDATVNDLFIDIHSLANVGSNGSSGGSSPEYDAGYGIQILNNVISVSGIAPQVQSDWNQTNTSSVDYIKNKPEEYGLLAGENISITASGNNFIISSTASSVEPIDYQAGYGIDITGDTISVDASIIPSTSAYATHTEVNNVSAAIIAQIPEQQINSDWTATSGVAEILNKPNESELIAGAGVSITASGSNYIISAVVTGSPIISGYVTEAELETVSGTLNTKIDNVSAAIPELPSEEEVEFEELDLSDYALASAIPDVSNLATKSELQTVSAAIPDVSNLATKTELATVSASIPDISDLATETELQIVSAAIPDTSNLATKVEVSIVSGSLNSKIDTVSGAIPTLPDEEEVVFEELDLSNYALASSIPDISNLASKSEVNAVSGTLQTEIVAISGAMVDVPTGVSGVVAGQGISITASGSDYVISCTVTGGSSYSAGSGINITNDVISIDNTVALKNEIQTYTGGDYISIDNSNTITVTGFTDLVAGDNITITASGSSAIISGQAGGGYYTAGTGIDITNNEISIDDTVVATKTDIPVPVSGASGISVNDNVISLDNPIGLVAGTNVSIEVTGSSAIISAVGGSGTSDVSMADLVSVSGTLQAEIQTVSGSIPSIANLATKTEVANVEADVQIVSAAIPTLPTEEEVEFTEIDLSDYALASAIPDVSNFVTGPTVSAIVDTALVDVPTGVSGLVGGTNVSITASGSNYVIDATVPDVSNLATKTEVQTVSAAIPDVSNLATKTEVTTGLGTKQNTLTGITDVQVVQALPVSPVSTVLYLIPEA